MGAEIDMELSSESRDQVSRIWLGGETEMYPNGMRHIFLWLLLSAGLLELSFWLWNIGREPRD